MGSAALTDALRETLAVFEDSDDPRTTPEVADQLDLGRRSTYARLERLADCDRLRTKKVGANARVWWQPSTASTDDRYGRAVFESLVDAVDEYAIFTLDTDGYVRTWNPGAERINGYDTDEILGEHVSTFYTEDDCEAGVPERDLRAAAENGAIQIEGWRRRADDGTFWATVSLTAIRDEDGTLEGYAKVTRDMTQHREYERQLRRERDLTEQLLETAPVSLAIVDADGAIDRVNPQTRRQFGMDDAPIDTISDIDVYDEDGEPITSAVHPITRVLETGERVDNQMIQHEGPTGDRRWLSVTAAPLSTDADVDQAVVAGKDVTNLKLTERELTHQRDKLRAELDSVFERIDDGVFAVDEDWTLTYVNDTTAAALGRPANELLGESLWEAFPGLTGSVFEETYREAMESQEPRSVEAYFEPFGGWYHDAVYPSKTGLSVYFRDISARKAREQELERYERIVETVDEGIYVVDQDGHFTFVNDTYVSMTERSREALLGAHVSAVIEDDRILESAREREAQLGAGTQVTEPLEVELTSPDGESRIGETMFAIMDTDDGYERIGAVRDVTERIERERTLERQREQLVASNSLHEVVREVTTAAIAQSTREEIEETVCAHLADAESYRFAWIGDADPATQTVHLRTGAGVGDYLDGTTISVDPDDAHSQGPTGRAFTTGEVQTTHATGVDSRHGPWRDHPESSQIQSSAAVPIVHDDTLYGVLNVYADRHRAFVGQERDLVAQLGEIVGHAIAAAERKQALMSDDVVELAFQIQGVFDALDVPTETDGVITLDHAVPTGDGEFVVYGTATTDAIEAVHSAAESLPHWQTLTVYEGGDPVDFEVRLSDPPVLSTVASLGGTVERATIEGGDYRMVIHLAPSVDVHRAIDAVESAYPQAEMIRRRQLSRTRTDSAHTEGPLVDDLTDRQRTTLETAYQAGYFEWPRNRSGETVAASLDIAPATFHQHLRKAQRKVYDTVFSTVEPDLPSPSDDG